MKGLLTLQNELFKQAFIANICYYLEKTGHIGIFFRSLFMFFKGK